MISEWTQRPGVTFTSAYGTDMPGNIVHQPLRLFSPLQAPGLFRIRSHASLPREIQVELVQLATVQGAGGTGSFEQLFGIDRKMLVKDPKSPFQNADLESGTALLIFTWRKCSRIQSAKRIRSVGESFTGRTQLAR